MLLKRKERKNILKDYSNENNGKKILNKTYRVYTNPPCIDRLSYHTFNQKSLRQIDTRPKKCYMCDSNPVIIINKKYYCAEHGLEEA